MYVVCVYFFLTPVGKMKSHFFVERASKRARERESVHREGEKVCVQREREREQERESKRDRECG